MTSAKSSHNTFAFTFRKAFRSLLVVPAIFGTLLYLFAYNGAFEMLVNYRKYISKGMFESAMKLKDSFIFFISDYDPKTVLVTWIMIILSALAAINIFGFMISKSSSNVWFSLGISRKNLFVSKYFAGAFALFLSVFVPFAIITGINISLFGFSKELIITVANIMLGYFNIQLFSFTVMALCMTMVGSYLEAIVMGGVAILSPALISDALCMFMHCLPYGSPYTYSGVLFSSNSVMDSHGRLLNNSFQIIHPERYYLPGNYITLMLEKGKTLNAPSFKWPLFFLAVIIVLAVVAAVSFSRRKAEKSGFMGTSPLLEGFCVVTVGSELSVLIYRIFEFSGLTFKGHTAMIILAGIAVMIIGYTVVDLICVRSIKAYIKRLPHLAAELGIFLAITLMITFIGSAKCAKLPQKDEIESASISLLSRAENNYQYSYAEQTMDGADFYSRFADRATCRTLIEGFKDSADIDRILEINNCLLDRKDVEENLVPMMISYKLKNGKTVTRTYKTFSGEDNGMLTGFYDTEQYRDFILGGLRYDDQYSFPVIANRDLSSVKTLTRSSEEITALYDAVKQDLKLGRAGLKINTDDRLLGYIILRAGSSVCDENGYPVISDEDTDYRDQLWFCNYTVLPLTDKMTATLEFIDSHGMSAYLETGSKEPVKVSVCKYGKPITGNDLTGEYSGRYYGIKSPGDMYYEPGVEYYYDEHGNEVQSASFYTDEIMPKGSKKVTDPKLIKEIADSFLMKAELTDDICIVRVEYEDETVAYGFAPAAIYDNLK